MQPGFNFPDTEVEPWVGINPVDPMNVVATWQQDRWSNGGARGLVAGVSFDGGRSWETVPVPGLTPCSGGSFLRASDPWLSFAPDGVLHHIALAFTPGGSNGMLVSKSNDGGRTWSNPKTVVLNTPQLFNDKETITADPNDPDFVYAVWDRLNFAGNQGPTLFIRSSDGGMTWEPARVIHNPGSNAQTVANQIVVGPDGTVYNFFTEIFNFPTGANFLALKRSFTRGQGWLPPVGAKRAHRMRPLNAFDPDLGTLIRDGAFLFDVAVDRRSGNLYAVWQEGSLSGLSYPAIAFSMSTNRGLSWSAPIAVNRTPSTGPIGNRQAFIPSVAVNGQGMVAVSYYDFRFNGPETGSLTDHWLTWCHPEAVDCTRSDRWRSEARLTDESFDILRAPFANGLFVGDYVGLAGDPDGFLAVFSQPHGADRSSVFSRRIVIEASVEPRSAGFWKHQVRVARSGRGHAEETETSLLSLLADIHARYDVFDPVRGVGGLESVLDPAEGSEPRAQTGRQLMALLLNLASSRLSPFVEVDAGTSVSTAAADIAGVLTDPGSGHTELEAAKDLAETINSGFLSLD